MSPASPSMWISFKQAPPTWRRNGHQPFQVHILVSPVALGRESFSSLSPHTKSNWATWGEYSFPCHLCPGMGGRGIIQPVEDYMVDYAAERRGRCEWGVPTNYTACLRRVVGGVRVCNDFQDGLVSP